MKNISRISSVWNFALLFTCLFSISTSSDLRAQATLVPPSSITSYVNNYPAIPTPGWQARSCCSYANALINGSYYDLFISAWRDPSNVAHIVWRASDFSAPSTITTTGADTNFTIPGTTSIQNITVGIIETASGGYQAIVVYNDVGTTGNVGVVINVYDVLTTGPQLNISPVSTTVLYSKINYNTRVCMDSRKQISAVVWNEIDPISSKTVIKCLPIKAGTFNNTVLLNNTDNNINADVAILENPSAGGYHLHFLSYNTVTYSLTESIDTFSVVYNASLSGFITYPTIEDVNNLGSGIANIPRACIDCPGNSSDENWAYVYFTDASNNDLYVRLVDYNTSSLPTTVNLTNGLMGNNPLNNMDNSWTTITYGKGNDNIFVGWQTQDSIPTLKNFVCMQISSDGSSILSANDYLLLSPYTTYYPNGILLSKNNEGPSLYAISSSCMTASSGPFRADHYFHYWSNPTSTFKGETKINTISDVLYNVSIWPNPFTNSLTMDVSSSLMNETIKASLTDILGRTIFSKVILGRDLNDLLNRYSPKMNPGNYWLNLVKPTFRYSQVLPLVKTGSN